MSEYTILDVCFKDEKALLEAVKEMGYTSKVYSTPVSFSCSRSEKCHILISRNGHSGCGNEAGFLREKDGQYKVIMRESRLDVNKLKAIYAQKVVDIYLASRSELYEQSRETLDDGRVRIRVQISGQ